jgi:hypothetical protein
MTKGLWPASLIANFKSRFLWAAAVGAAQSTQPSDARLPTGRTLVSAAEIGPRSSSGVLASCRRHREGPGQQPLSARSSHVTHSSTGPRVVMTPGERALRAWIAAYTLHAEIVDPQTHTAPAEESSSTTSSVRSTLTACYAPTSDSGGLNMRARPLPAPLVEVGSST